MPRGLKACTSCGKPMQAGCKRCPHCQCESLKPPIGPTLKEEQDRGKKNHLDKTKRSRWNAVQSLLMAASYASGYDLNVMVTIHAKKKIQIFSEPPLSKKALSLLTERQCKKAGLPDGHNDCEMFVRVSPREAAGEDTREECQVNDDDTTQYDVAEVSGGGTGGGGPGDSGDGVGGDGVGGDGVGGDGVGGDGVGGDGVGGDGVGGEGGDGVGGEGADGEGGDGVGGEGGDGVGGEGVGGDGVSDGGGNGEGGDGEGVGGVKDGSKHGSAGGGVGSDGHLETESGDQIYMIEGVAVKERSLRDLVNAGDPDLMDLVEATERSTERFAPRGEAAKRKVLPESSKKTRVVKKKRQVAPVNADDTTKYDVEKVLSMREKKGKRDFLIRWTGYGRDQDSYISEKDAKDQLGTMYEDFMEKAMKKRAKKRTKKSA